MAEEHIFFEDSKVKVTNARFISDGQTFVMSNITSVKSYVITPSRGLPVVMIVIGLFSLFAWVLFGLILIGIAVLILLNQKSTYCVMLNTAGGEVRALHSFQRSYIDNVITALNDAIIERG